MRLSIILQRLRVLSVSWAQPRLRTISKMARISRPADWVTYTMSAMRAKPSSFSWEMKAWRSTLILALGSSMLSFTGIGTRSSNF